MSLNPSCNNVQGKPLPVLGDPPFLAERAEVAKAELREVFPQIEFDGKAEEREVLKPGTKAHSMASAGIYVPSAVGPNDTMVVTLYDVEAHALGWKFRRAWYYWVCATADSPIPEALARKLNADWGTQVRVDGFAGGTEPGGDVYTYHVDTLDGLKALVAAIRIA